MDAEIIKEEQLQTIAALRSRLCCGGCRQLKKATPAEEGLDYEGPYNANAGSKDRMMAHGQGYHKARARDLAAADPDVTSESSLIFGWCWLS